MGIDKAAIVVPEFNLDKIITTGAGDVTYEDVPNRFQSVATAVPIGSLPIAIYSYDGGTTWNDAGTTIYEVLTPALAQQAEIRSSDGLLTFAGKQYGSLNGGSDYTVTIKWAAIALPDTTVVDDSDFAFSGGTAYTSKDKYMKIAAEGSVTVDGTTDVTTTIDHNLGYEPFCMVWIEDSLDIHFMDCTVGLTGGGDFVTIGTNSIVITTQNHSVASLPIHYKIYEKN